MRSLRDVHEINARRAEDEWGSEGIAPRIFNLCSKRRRVVRFGLRLHYARGKSPGTYCIGGVQG
jgi:hypothetical protein